MDKSELKPCPFCGGKAEIGETYSNDRICFVYYVSCQGCSADIVSTQSEQDAIKAWNRRA